MDQVHPQTRYTQQTRYTPRTRYPPDQVHPPDKVHPPDQIHPPDKYPPTRYIPLDQVPARPGTSPLPGNPPGPGNPPPRSSACWEIRATSGRYASYWNAYFLNFSTLVCTFFVTCSWAGLLPIELQPNRGGMGQIKLTNKIPVLITLT